MAQNSEQRKFPTYDSKNVSCLGKTDIEQEKFSFLWTVSSYSSVRELKEVKSPIFYGGPKKNHSWQLKICNLASEYVTLKLMLANYGDGISWWERLWRPVVKAKVRLSILNRDGQVGYRKGPQTFDFRAYTFWGCADFISVIYLPYKNLVVNNQLKILCEFEILGELKQSVGIGGLAKSIPSNEERIKWSKLSALNDFEKIFRNSVATDVTLSTGKTSFKAHKVILAARSSVFAAMLNSNMIEKETATVEITDFEDEVVKGMLEHLYTGQTDYMSERAPELLQIAEKYELVGLKEDCQYVIADNLDEENAVVILVLAHSHNAPYLKERAMNFINLHKEELLKSKTFQDAVKAHSNPDVFVDLYLSQ